MKATTVERNGEIIGAAFPAYSIMIVLVPFFDPDRDGAANGTIYALRVQPAPGKTIEHSGWGNAIGMTGPKIHLQGVLQQCVDSYNK